ncbi:MAG: hypothetical protein CVU39_09750 [Chloroflexi bacterium HGW-Chloroflexi-10]|nr:MAG: hypothetical protein CVU39_09750 [Chloroflexi bacterium HGW-Chloroflexi-10]
MIKKNIIGALMVGLLLVGGTGAVFAHSGDGLICSSETSVLELLDMTAQELREANAAGKTIETLFEESSLDFDSYVEEWATTKLACIEQALIDGEITEDQAARLKDSVEERAAEGKPYLMLKGLHRNGQINKFRFTSFENMAEVLSMDAVSLKAAFEDGMTLAEIAEEQGVDLDAAYADWVAAQIADIEQVVTDGKLTEEQAENLITRLEEKLAEGFDAGDWNPNGRDKPLRDRVIIQSAKDLAGEVLDALGMTRLEIREALQAGQTIEDLAAEKDVDLNAIYSSWLEIQKEVVNQAFEDGKITQEQADSILERLQTQMENGFPENWLEKVLELKSNRMPNRDPNRGNLPMGDED